MLEALSIPPSNGEKPEYLLILLHGWGANYQDLVPLASQFNLPNYQYLFPNAPFNHPQAPEGKAWYSLESDRYDGIEESRKLLYNWLSVLPENTGVPLNKTILVGFSQGGAMCLDIGLKLPVAGVCVLSGFLHYEPEKQDNPFPPVLMCHGTSDPILPIDLAKMAKQKLESVGVKIEYHEFDIEHGIIPEEIELIKKFLP